MQVSKGIPTRGPGEPSRPEEGATPGGAIPEPGDRPVAEVAVAAPISAEDGLLDYRVPPELAGQVRPGARLLVPLQGRVVEGYCVRLKNEAGIPADRLKDVSSVLDPGLAYPAESLACAVWTARRYLCQPGEVLRAAVPARRRFKERMVARLAVDDGEARAAIARLKGRAPVQAAVLAELVQGPQDVTSLRRRLEVRASRGLARTLATLGEKGLVTVDRVGGSGSRRRKAGPAALPERAGPPDAPGDEAGGRTIVPAAGLRLSPAQETALDSLVAALPGGRNPGGVFLLHGVTGSGKTEVYLRAAAETLARGRRVLILVPEVALMPQTMDRVSNHLGRIRIAVAHSYLAGKERAGYWEMTATGEADVVVGARSAVFAPLDRLGLIVLDEEHEDAYKQEEGTPRYHAREVAEWRARQVGAVLALVSATPSLESYHRALRGDYTLLSLPERVAGGRLPPVEIVDMRSELAAGNRSLFSTSLGRALGRVLRDRRQAILLLNRRGHSTFVLCRDCGWVARCPACDVSLVYHNPGADLQCHYCGHRAATPSACPGCGGHRVRYFGAGTQKVEDEIKLLFPDARTARLDADVVRRPGEAQRLMALFESGHADVLVGTQMVAKGLDLPGVELVAAVAADSALHLPDFRSAEKTFRLLTQAAGRAGRRGDAGRVIIQTYSPEHPAVAFAAAHDYGRFATAELESRRELGYPPWTHLVRVELSDPDEAGARRAAEALALRLADLGFSSSPGDLSLRAGELDRPRFAGPAPAPIGRLRGRHRWHVLVFSADLDTGLEAVRGAVLTVTGREARGGRRRAPTGVVASVDVDPVSVL